MIHQARCFLSSCAAMFVEKLYLKTLTISRKLEQHVSKLAWVNNISWVSLAFIVITLEAKNDFIESFHLDIGDKQNFS